MITASHPFVSYLSPPTWSGAAKLKIQLCAETARQGAGTHPHVAWSEYQVLRFFTSSAAGSRAGWRKD